VLEALSLGSEVELVLLGSAALGIADAAPLASMPRMPCIGDDGNLMGIHHSDI